MHADDTVGLEAGFERHEVTSNTSRLSARIAALEAELESIVATRTRELVEKNKELEVLSVTDKLTGLFNRRKIDQVLDEELIRARRYDVDFCVIIVDLDHFKRINDTHGHAVGDEVLVRIGQILRHTTRDADALGRLGGEEFLVVCRHSPVDTTLALADKIRAAVAAHDFTGIGHVTASFGVAACRGDDSAASLLARADAALYRAKDGGRNKVEREHAFG
jgi:diguanylate cyclase (GGDEF)-like protein